MKAEEYFEDMWANNALFQWMGLNKVDMSSLKQIVVGAYKAGEKSVWESVSNDRRMLEGLIESLDQKDMWAEQEALREGG